MTLSYYDFADHTWAGGGCPYGDLCSGCDANGFCERMETRWARAIVDVPGPSEFDVENMKNILGGMGDWWSARFLRLCAQSDRQHLEALRRAAPAHVAAFERWCREGP